MPLEGRRWWLAGVDPRTRKWTVAISADDGRSWAVSPLMPPLENLSDSWAVVGYGKDLYAADVGEVGGDYAMVAIFYSGDSGRSWRRTSRAPLRMVDSLVAAADGTLLASTAVGGTLISRNHGHTFSGTAKRYNGHAYWAGAGYVAASDPEHPIMFSRDGLSWDRLNLSS
jgi:photosystem II stability/assembly factor-like uncharacterized protein